ncbi:hypothetical protein HPB49_024223 [Dermacentor silvarum]|uniref:Uncharacterized protein n=1 Tax=Dermacentor silvarum TaxID=543639 RepID=A0ACB8D0Z2_DERSI|nr:hypothetical protein HPB49_024223 [Dermacentor silvarum]
MRPSFWDTELAEVAQAHADQCSEKRYAEHDKKQARGTVRFPRVGQNVGWRGENRNRSSATWSQRVKNWFDEYKDYPPEGIASFKVIRGPAKTGHFTQRGGTRASGTAATQVEGETLLAEDFTDDLGWRTVSSRKSRATTKPGLGDGGARSEMPERRGAGEWRKGLVIKNRIVKAPRMPPMPEEHIKIVIRPRRGLNLEKISPPTPRHRSWRAPPRKPQEALALSEPFKVEAAAVVWDSGRREPLRVYREARVRFPAAGGGGGAAGGQTTWADKHRPSA